MPRRNTTPSPTPCVRESTTGALGLGQRCFGGEERKRKETAMSTATAKGYLVRRIQDAPTIHSACGQSTRPLTASDGVACNLHVTFITDSVKHYHRQCTEVYYILEGQGKMELNDDVIEVEPGMVVYIEPYTAHRLSSPEGVRTVVFGVPALRAEDEYFDVA